MPTSLSNIKVTDGQNNLVITGNDITINGTSILGQNNFVTLDTDQTINGIKTFTTFPRISNNSDDIAFVIKDTGLATNNTTPSANRFRSFRYFANDSSIVADLRLRSTTSGTSVAEILARRTINGSSYNGAISVTVNSNGNAYTYAPAPSDTTSTSSNQIATTGWVNTVGNNVVHRTGDETISGNKTFLFDTFRKATNIERGVAPSTVQYASYMIRDKDDKQIANFYVAQEANNTMVTSMIATNLNSSNNAFDARISVAANRDGTVYTRAPTPATSDNSTQIATTAFVNNKFQVVSALPSSPDSNTFYFIPA